jgi:hypothetical protein
MLCPNWASSGIQVVGEITQENKNNINNRKNKEEWKLITGIKMKYQQINLP